MDQIQMDEIKLSVPSKPEYVGVIRLTLAAIASRIGFDIEKIEDMKVAVAEACTNAIIHGCHCKQGSNFNIDFVSTGEKLTISVYDDGEGCQLDNIEEPDLSKPKEGGLGIFIIKSLMDDVEIESEKGKGMMIKMIKYLGDDA
ncbi:ATP-binding protein [Alkaliphilus sp. MSJ-5]|uniref:ATP-binding protein n=1 Tax=Alkaliphilus flagellatus TaxID=2841507 RepID=A0ABS6G1B4_9FIRM|nr:MULTISPECIES: ATP-binding protein [Alkaliphilus]MBU5676285.1 ATP-binding protein [Alkaliphilus flagellatus]QUH19363.1 ATP-binding protein [Alkaliphilus sp. B6464]